MSVNKDIKNLHFKYLFSIAYLNPEEQHVLLEEEKVFYKHVFNNQSNLFKFGNQDKQMDNFIVYTTQVIQNVQNNYMSVFKDKTLSISQENFKDIENILNVSLISFNKTLDVQLQNQRKFEYITCVLICSCLLFLIRTTKRALFIYISQESENRNVDIFTNVKYVIEYITSFISSINQSVESQRLMYEDLNSANTKLKLLREQVENLNNTIDLLETSKVQFEKELTDKKKLEFVLQRKDNEINVLTKEKDRLTQEHEYLTKQLEISIKDCNDKLANALTELQSDLDQCRADNNKLRNDPEIQKQIQEKTLRDTEDFKRGISAITNLAIKFKALLDRWENDVDNHKLIITKITNHIENLEENKLNLIKSGINVLEPVSIKYKNINQGDKFELIAQLIDGLVSLHENQIIERNANMEIFFDTKELYKTLVLLFEDLSGAVRVVVKVRNSQQTCLIGGKRKIRNYNHQTNTRKKMKKLLIGGSDPEFQDYKIALDKASMRVSFINLPIELFKKPIIDFGPFFSVHDNSGYTQRNVNSAEMDILQSIQFDNLKLIFENNLVQNEKPPALLLYTYGYSGSGKTYTLFGELSSRDGQPKNGVFWKIIDELKKHYEIAFESTSKCYGYLKQEVNYSDSVKFFNDAKRGYNSEKPVIDQVKNDTNKWSKYIMSLLGKTLDTDSFIKTTSNNPESSRGFLILKIALYSVNNENDKKELKGYIGVIDMAGSEDPYDIATSLCPTMDFSRMHNLIKSKLQDEKSLLVSDYDSFYALLQEYISDIIAPSIICSLLTHSLGYKRDLDDIKKDITAYNNDIDNINNTFSLTPTYADKLKEFPILNTLSNDIERLIVFISTGNEPNIKPNTPWDPLKFDKERDGKDRIVKYKYNNIDEKIFEFHMATRSVTFYLSRPLLLEILGLLKKLFPYSGSTPVSIDDIKKQLHLKADINKLTAMKIVYAEQSLPNEIYTDKFEIKFPLTAGMTYNIKNIIKDIKSEIINKLRKLLYFDKSYFIPFTTDNQNQDKYTYKYSMINRIISEGFYINKANAELISYFDKKIKMQKDMSYQSKDTPYKFYENFDYTTPVNKSKTNTNNKQFNTETKNTFINMKGEGVNEYNTNLIPLLTSMFPGKNKDILITCVRDDKEYGKVKGALDTLKLVEDLKST
jgi:Kinesin motor domain